MTLTNKRGGASVAPLVVHGSNHRPLVRHRVIYLCCILSDVTIKATHGVELVAMNCDADVTSEICDRFIRLQYRRKICNILNTVHWQDGLGRPDV
jgi:hypothetical protein